MTKLIVIEHAGENFTRVISTQIARFGGGVSVTHILPAAEFDEGEANIIVVSPSYHFAESEPKLRGGILLTPSGVPRFAEARCVVTYGMSPKDTLTLSSIGEDACVLALQRELITADGGILERQEFKIPACGSTDESLACSGAMLLLGLQPSDYA
ncbi:MAG: hypothetical protein FWC96_06090 [Oscillospiraceae bacterium]|nr:hypothetical protein [Oscillospiraceae bacterium]